MKYTLHDNPDLAARSLADQDVKRTLNHAVIRLGWTWTGKHLDDPLVRWARYRRANYYWLARFCESLQVRSSTKHYELIKSLKLSYPPAIIRGGFDQPVNVPCTYSYQASLRHIASNRAAYYRARRKNAKWTTSSQPAWFLKRSVSLLHEDTRARGALLRRLFAGLGSANKSSGKQKPALRPLGTNTVRYDGIRVRYF